MSEREYDLLDYFKNALDKIEGGSTNIFLLKQDLERIIEWKTERNALKEQLGKLMKFMASVENFDYIWTNHSNIPQFYTMITKGHYATCVDARKRVDDAESRVAEAEKDVAELKRIRKAMRGRRHE